MSGHLLRLHTQPALSIDLHTLHPERLRGLSATEVSHLPLRHGRDAATVGDFCHVSTATDMPDTLTLDGDFSCFHRIGQGLKDGRIVVTGSVGDLAGAGMRGGQLVIEGHARDLTGCEMAGGRLEVHGNVRDHAAGAQVGSLDGMRGGTFIVRGHAGARLADRMRRGTLVVCGDTGDHLASRMVAGTVLVGGRTGAHPAWGMRRGSLVFAGPAPDLGPTFAPNPADVRVAWQLLARHLAPLAAGLVLQAVDLPRHAPARRTGDLSVSGIGDVFVLG